MSGKFFLKFGVVLPYNYVIKGKAIITIYIVFFFA